MTDPTAPTAADDGDDDAISAEAVHLPAAAEPAEDPLAALLGGGGPGGFDFGALMEQAGQMQAQLLAAQEQAASTVVEGVAGGGAVRVAVTGAGACVFRATALEAKLTANWSADALKGALSLPTRRYVQLEVGVDGPASELRDISLFYAPENLPPLVQSVAVAGPELDEDDEGEPDPRLTIKWKAEARDDDDLVYEVRIRPEGSPGEWIKLGGEAPVTKKELKWDLGSVPDGVYEAQVVASDEPTNGSARARTDEVVSAPFVVDHKRPSIDEVKVQGSKVSARARDEGSRIIAVHYSIDGGSFHAASPADGLFDGDSEPFEIVLPADLKPGKHRVVLRARDSFGNLGTAAIITGG